MPTCPECGAEVDLLHFNGDFTNLQYADGKWSKVHNNDDSVIQCSHCFAELDDDQLDKLGVPMEVRS